MIVYIIKSVKHENGKTRLASREKRQKNISEMLQKFDQDVHPERVFSLLNNSFKEQQYSSLEDYIETSIMLQYNAK